MKFKKKYAKRRKFNDGTPPIQRKQFNAFSNALASGNKALAEIIANGNPENYDEKR